MEKRMVVRLVGVISGRLESCCFISVANSSTAALATSGTARVQRTTEEAFSHEWKTAKPYHEIPGPKPLPIVGNAWRFVPGVGDMANIGMIGMNKKLLQDFGKIVRLTGIPGRKDVVFISDPDDIEKVFRNDGMWPVREGLPSFQYYREVTRKEFYQGAGGLVTTQGVEWGNFRSSVNQPMLQPRTARSYVSSIADVTDDFLKRIYFIREENGEMPEDFLYEFYKWGLESMSKIALDIRLGCLANDLKPNSEPQQMIECVQNMFDCLYKLNISVPVWKLFSTPTWRRYVKYSDLMTDIAMRHVNKALERQETQPADSDRQLSVLEKILARNPNPKVACVMAVDMLTAGIDTTTNACSFLWYHLARNPDKQQKLQAEIDRVLDHKQLPITPENINELRYLKACIKESMRVSPIIIGNFRAAGNDMVLQGYKIPKGTDVQMNNLLLSTMEEYFPDADKFKPERWVKGEPENEHKPHPFVSLPFGFGARMCIGRRFAELEITIATIKILQHFNLEWHYGPIEVTSGFINTCGSPLKFKMVDRT